MDNVIHILAILGNLKTYSGLWTIFDSNKIIENAATLPGSVCMYFERITDLFQLFKKQITIVYPFTIWDIKGDS